MAKTSLALASSLGAYRNVGLLGRFLVGSTTVSGNFVAAVAALVGWFAINGQLSVGGLIAAVGLAQALLAPMQMIAMNAVPSWAAAIASSGRVLDALKDTPASVPGSTPGQAPTEPIAAASPVRVPVVELSLASRGAVRVEPGELLGLRAAERTAAGIADVLLNPHTHGDVAVSIDGTRGLDLARTARRWWSHPTTRRCSAARPPTTSPSPECSPGCVRKRCGWRRARTSSPRPAVWRGRSGRWATGCRAGSVNRRQPHRPRNAAPVA